MFALRRLFSACSAAHSAGLSASCTTFCFTTFVMDMDRSAYRNVLMDSSTLFSAGETQAIKTVQQFPTVFTEIE
jgi:hypothetical protein